MIKRLLFLLILIALVIILYFNPNFETIAAGIAILLFGMILLEEGFKVFTRGPLQNFLKKATDKLYKSITAGAFVTTLMQSSSLVSVITISFISAGLISLSGGIGLIFGANIGSTTTAWLVAGFGLKIKISSMAMPMIIFGLIFSFQKSSALKGIGNVLAGLGFFFLGIFFMKEGFDVFSTQIDLTQYAVSGYLGVLIYTVIGIIITIVLQSSAASLVLVLTALAAGQIEYENALAIAIGANVGTTITAVLGSLKSNIAGKRLAGAHLIFNIITGFVALAFIYPLSKFVDYFSALVNISQTDYTLKLALFHTTFNIIGVVIMIPFIKKLESFLIKFFKEKIVKDIDEPKYLNEAVLKFPDATISALVKETKYLYKNAVFEIVSHALNIHREDIISDIKINKIIKKSTRNFNIDIDKLYYKKFKNIYGEILRFATTAQNDLKLTKKHNKSITDIKISNRKMVEIIKDVRELNKNLTMSLTLDNKYLLSEYNDFRKKITQVLRVIYLFRTEEETEKYAEKLEELKTKAKENIRQSNKSIDKLIRKNLITAEMASSLFNDYSNVNDINKKLIEVAELLYGNKDSLFENSEDKNNI
ncbi:MULTISPECIES: Na/Pi cotransporter family protein [Flavobacteriaceae]|uniref:Na/Pi cotransporter family protein n=2 Tax=Flavobacteriaceae TaxID=49546 RepID=A0A4Y8ASR3_9FLAO|nr:MULTISPECIES: Na/Pi symporter [Flavobacteriaceae]TEW73686.1 Na/Pi cotransporter family protein [Gramella jeungdoensis]GGK36683.1 sodium-dependent phosphate transporter [Lutibacter litoralis]